MWTLSSWCLVDERSSLGIVVCSCVKCGRTLSFGGTPRLACMSLRILNACMLSSALGSSKKLRVMLSAAFVEIVDVACEIVWSSASHSFVGEILFLADC